jgi:hypothetical protein
MWTSRKRRPDDACPTFSRPSAPNAGPRRSASRATRCAAAPAGLDLPRAGGGEAQAFRLPRGLRHRGAGREAQIEEFYRDGWVREPADIFTLEDRYGPGNLTQAEEPRGLGREIGRNLFAAIRERQTIPLRRLIFALGIRHVGEAGRAFWPRLRQLGGLRGGDDACRRWARGPDGRGFSTSTASARSWRNRLSPPSTRRPSAPRSTGWRRI